MADRQDSDREVLTSLPRTRPVRRSAKRGDRADAKSTGAGATARRSPATKPRAAKATASATKAKAKAATAGAAKTSPRTAPKAADRPRTAPRRKVPPAGYAAPSGRADDGGASSAADLLSTSIQAAAELAQIGLTVGRQTLQSMLDRLPKP